MSVHSLLSNHAITQSAAAHQTQPTPKQTTPKNAIPQDQVTISAAAKAKQNAQAARADGDHDGK
ncbi:MAG TPA: hypothetical protein VJN93_07495 [Candidatus Acidoferrum sp.]|nr:hypothetical protein [Candidatus Acidoferrum sp.]